MDADKAVKQWMQEVSNNRTLLRTNCNKKLQDEVNAVYVFWVWKP